MCGSRDCSLLGRLVASRSTSGVGTTLSRVRTCATFHRLRSVQRALASLHGRVNSTLGSRGTGHPHGGSSIPVVHL